MHNTQNLFRAFIGWLTIEEWWGTLLSWCGHVSRSVLNIEKRWVTADSNASARHDSPSNNSTKSKQSRLLCRLLQKKRCGEPCIVQLSEHMQCDQALLCVCWRETVPSHFITLIAWRNIFHLSSLSLWLRWRAIQQMFVDCGIQRIASQCQFIRAFWQVSLFHSHVI